MSHFLYPSHIPNKQSTHESLFWIGPSFVTSIPKFSTLYMLLLIWLSRCCWAYKISLTPKSPVLHFLANSSYFLHSFPLTTCVIEPSSMELPVTFVSFSRCYLSHAAISHAVSSSFPHPIQWAKPQLSRHPGGHLPAALTLSLQELLQPKICLLDSCYLCHRAPGSVKLSLSAYSCLVLSSWNFHAVMFPFKKKSILFC